MPTTPEPVEAETYDPKTDGRENVDNLPEDRSKSRDPVVESIGRLAQRVHGVRVDRSKISAHEDERRSKEEIRAKKERTEKQKQLLEWLKKETKGGSVTYGSMEGKFREFAQDADFMAEVIRMDRMAIKFADESLRSDQAFIATVFEKLNYRYLKSVFENAPKVVSDRGFILAEIEESKGEIFEYVDPLFQKDREIVSLAIRLSRGKSLRYADSSLRADREIVSEAIAFSSGRALEHADQSIK